MQCTDRRLLSPIFLSFHILKRIDILLIKIYNSRTKKHTNFRWGDIMLAVKSMDLREHFKEWCNKVIGGETLVISRPKNENVVIVSEKEYNALQKAKQNAEYLEKLDRSLAQSEQGKTISFTMEELREMESDDWTPTQKVMDFMEKMAAEKRSNE